MILVSGTRGPGFDYRKAPRLFFFPLAKEPKSKGQKGHQKGEGKKNKFMPSRKPSVTGSSCVAVMPMTSATQPLALSLNICPGFCWGGQGTTEIQQGQGQQSNKGYITLVLSGDGQ